MKDHQNKNQSINLLYKLLILKIGIALENSKFLSDGSKQLRKLLLEWVHIQK